MSEQGSGPTTRLPILPDDGFNRALIEHVHPTSWINPSPKPRYNLVVLGGGTAGLVSAALAAGLGARVALVEKHLLGGDCLNYGCVPSKAVIRAARAAFEHSRSREFGVAAAGGAVDFAHVMERMRKLRAGIAPHDSARRLQAQGVDVFFGAGEFSGPSSLEVAGVKLEFSRAIIATGTRPTTPSIPGLGETGFLSNESVFELVTLPKRLAVLGGGPVGCEMGQAFRRLGSEVAIVSLDARLLPSAGRDASDLLATEFGKEGIALFLGAKVSRVERRAEQKVVVFERGHGLEEYAADELLVAVGRTPTIGGLALERARVSIDANGVKVDDRLRTSNPRIYCAGDVCSPYKFTHAADAMAKLAVRNALFFGKQSVKRLVIPSCTYTEPEVANVGLSEDQARERGVRHESFTIRLEEVDRAVLDGATLGFARIVVHKGSGRILGATAVGRHAGEMIGTITLAITEGASAGSLSRSIAPYPTAGEVWKRLGDAYLRKRLTPSLKRLLARYFAWRR